MKKLMILGAIIGFAIGLIFATSQRCSGSAILWRASIAAVIAGYLFRWWGTVWVNALQESFQEKLRVMSEEPKQSNPGKI